MRYIVVKRMDDGKTVWGKAVFGWTTLEIAREKRRTYQNAEPQQQFAVLDENDERIED